MSIIEYAKMHGMKVATVRRKCVAKNYKTAVKVGRNWLIDKNEPHIDFRCKKNREGSYGYHKIKEKVEELSVQAYKKHKEVFENWNHGEIQKVWFEEEALCIEYEDGQWYHYCWENDELIWW